MRLVSVGVKVTVLVGGVGGARFLLGVQYLLGLGQFGTHDTDEHDVTAVVNVGDDAWMFGVRICPDLDTCMYTLGGGIDPERGWGHANETWHAKEELAAYGVQPDWFGLGDRDLATHLVRTQMLRAGYPLSQVTEALCRRWQPGVRLLPASDDRSETHVVITDPEDGEKTRHPLPGVVGAATAPRCPPHSFAFVGADKATRRTGCHRGDRGRRRRADRAVQPGREHRGDPGGPAASAPRCAPTPAPVIGYSPIIAGKPLRGMADACLSVIGVETTSEAVGAHYGARSGTGILDGWLVARGRRRRGRGCRRCARCRC